MKESGITRQVLQIISRNSNLTADELEERFKQEGVYSDKNSWTKFIEIALISTGVAFVVAGIIFFLAFNWHLMDKFVKLGLVQALVTVLVISSFVFRKKPLFQNVLLAGASVLVGGMFSVFGQIYQTGADAYDFFLGWTVFTLIWALVADFPPLWLLVIALVNITVSLYVDQVAPYWSSDVKYLLLFTFNTVVLVILQMLPRFSKQQIPGWLVKVVSLSVVVYITIGAGIDIFDRHNASWPVFFLLAFSVYALAVYQSFKAKSVFNLCIVPLSIIVILCCVVWENLDDKTGMLFFFMSVFVIASITVLAKALVNLNKAWNE